MSRPTRGRIRFLPVRGHHPLWPAFPDGSGSDGCVTGLVRVRSPLLTESRLMSFPPATEMFQFAGLASAAYGFDGGRPLRAGFPHSEIPGSKPARGSPWLIATCCVLRRLSVPRHPPNALKTLELPQHHVPHSGKTPVRGQQRQMSDDRNIPHPPSVPAEESSSARNTAKVYSRPGRSNHDRSHSPILRTRPKKPLHNVKHPRSKPPGPKTRGPNLRRRGYPPRQTLLRPANPLSSAPSAPRDGTAQPAPATGGGERNRTDDLLLAKQALSQLSYTPFAAETASRSSFPRYRAFVPRVRAITGMVGLERFELSTSRLSSARSNQLSYRPLPERRRSAAICPGAHPEGVSQ